MALSGAAAQYIAKEFGGQYEEDDGTVSVQTSATQIVASDPDTVAITFVNLGANTVYLRPSNEPSITAGIQIVASGGALSLTVRNDLTLTTREWWGIATTAASDVYFVRVRRFAQ